MRLLNSQILANDRPLENCTATPILCSVLRAESLLYLEQNPNFNTFPTNAKVQLQRSQKHLSILKFASARHLSLDF